MLNVVRSLDLLEDSSHSQSVLTFCLETSILAKKYVFQFHWMDTCWMWTKISEANISTSFIGHQCLHTCMARLIPTWSWSLDASYYPGRERWPGPSEHQASIMAHQHSRFYSLEHGRQTLLSHLYFIHTDMLNMHMMRILIFYKTMATFLLIVVD